MATNYDYCQLTIRTVLAYCLCLGIAVYRHKKSSKPSPVMIERRDIESAVPVTPAQAELPIMPPPPPPRPAHRVSADTVPSRYSSNTDPEVSIPGKMSRPSFLDGPPAALSVATAHDGEDDSSSKKSRQSRFSARLSKRIPDRYF